MGKCGFQNKTCACLFIILRMQIHTTKIDLTVYKYIKKNIVAMGNS